MRYKNIRESGQTLAIAACALLLVYGPVSAQQPIVYPARGQSPAQIDADKGTCQAWATRETGFDPLSATAPPAPVSTAPDGRILRGGARGAAGGAAIGAIAGDAGKGAAIGAASGGLLSGMRKRQEQVASQQVYTQQAQAQSQQRDTFVRAYGACLQGRGYTVR
jgi:hypothetical protein